MMTRSVCDFPAPETGRSLIARARRGTRIPVEQDVFAVVDHLYGASLVGVERRHSIRSRRHCAGAFGDRLHLLEARVG